MRKKVLYRRNSAPKPHNWWCCTGWNGSVPSDGHWAKSPRSCFPRESLGRFSPTLRINPPISQRWFLFRNHAQFRLFAANADWYPPPFRRAPPSSLHSCRTFSSTNCGPKFRWKKNKILITLTKQQLCIPVGSQVLVDPRNVIDDSIEFPKPIFARQWGQKINRGEILSKKRAICTLQSLPACYASCLLNWISIIPEMFSDLNASANSGISTIRNHRVKVLYSGFLRANHGRLAKNVPKFIIQNAIGPFSISSGSAAFLIIVFQRFRQRMMNDEANVRLIDAHPERNRCHNHLQLIRRPLAVDAWADLRCHVGVIAVGLHEE